MKITKEKIKRMGDLVKKEGCPDDENIYLDIDRPKALRAARLWTGVVYWQCCECEATNEIYEEKNNDFVMSCEACYTVNQITILKKNIIGI